MRIVILVALACSQSLLIAADALPKTPKEPVTDIYHGVAVRDDYRWLENWHDKRVRDWSDAENAYARAWLDRLPDVGAIRARVTKIMGARTDSYFELAYRKGRLFAVKREPPKQQPFLIVLPTIDSVDRARVLVDPNVLDPRGTTAIDWYVPSPDGRRVAVSLSRGGSEAGDVHLFDAETGTAIGEIIPRVNTGTAGGSLAWMPDGSGFFYTRHPRPGERPSQDLDFYQQVYFHKLGTPTAADRYEIGKQFPRVAEIELEMHDRSGTLLLTVQNGDGGEFAHYLRSPSGRWTKISDFKDKIPQATFGPNDSLFMISRADALRGKIVRISLTNPDVARAVTVIPQGPDAVVTSFYHQPPSLLATEHRLYVLYQLGGPSELRVFDLAGKRLPGPKQLAISTVGGLTKLDGDDILFANTSYVAPPAFYRFHARSVRTEITGLATKSPVDFGDVEVAREFAISKDGTRIPVNLLLRKGIKRDGTNPALATGYGGYGISMTPSFVPVRHVLLAHGFVLAVANLRGGSEFGEAWHRQGSLTHKQNVFDDFTAVLRHLIDRRYTAPARLAIEGGSNGGLLMGAILTQHPELVRAVVSHVGIYDMLRSELSPNGAFNIAEFGTVKNPAQFRALFAYSPYHHVTNGVRYPAVLFLTGANDPRVDAMQSRKMIARLQAASASSEPILLRTSSNTGHGLDSPLSERIAQQVDVFAFLFDRLDVPDAKTGTRMKGRD